LLPIFLLGFFSQDDGRVYQQELMECAKQNEWGFGFCKSIEERDEELKNFATITKQIGINPQSGPPSIHGEMVMSSENSFLDEEKNKKIFVRSES